MKGDYMEEKIYTVAQVAAELGFTRQTVLYWIKHNKINAFKIMRDYRITESELNRIKGV